MCMLEASAIPPFEDLREELLMVLCRRDLSTDGKCFSGLLRVALFFLKLENNDLSLGRSVPSKGRGNNLKTRFACGG